MKFQVKCLSLIKHHPTMQVKILALNNVEWKCHFILEGNSFRPEARGGALSPKLVIYQKILFVDHFSCRLWILLWHLGGILEI